MARLGISPEEVIDFSSSINPYGPAPVVEKAARAADIERYPDKECRELRNALAAHLGVDATLVIAVGNGSAELIDHLARVYPRSLGYHAHRRADLRRVRAGQPPLRRTSALLE